MMPRAAEPSFVSDDLVNRALARASGANIHRLGQLITIYRLCEIQRPALAGPFEKALRVFAATGRLEIPALNL